MTTHAVVTKSSHFGKTARIPLYDKMDHLSIILRRGFQGNCKCLSARRADTIQTTAYQDLMECDHPRKRHTLATTQNAQTLTMRYLDIQPFQNIESSKTRFGKMCGSQSLKVTIWPFSKSLLTTLWSLHQQGWVSAFLLHRVAGIGTESRRAQRLHSQHLFLEHGRQDRLGQFPS